MAAMRTEQDSLGTKEIPVEAYYGIHTARAVENFPITGVGLRDFPHILQALAMIKLASAQTNLSYRLIDQPRADAIVHACRRIIDGEAHDQFVVDMIQGGAGTSTNMNANEVIANLALEHLGRPKGDYGHLHPNDHVNLSQSTNDVYPTAIRLALLFRSKALITEQQRLSAALRDRAGAFANVVKVGRTQLQDAVPMTLGQEFAGFAATVDEDVDRMRELFELVKEVNLGGTAIGTGINTPRGYAQKVVDNLSEIAGEKLRSATDLIEATSDTGVFITFSGVLKRVAVKVSKICNDLRLLSSGPRAGIGEIALPPVQAGSSIMPGKVNPVIPEVVNQIAYQVVGNDLTITMAAEAGQLQLNAMEPIIVFNLLQSIRILTNGMHVLTDRCVVGISANVERSEELLRNSLVLATALAPRIGYERAATVAKEAALSGKTIGEVVAEQEIMSAEDFADLTEIGALLGRHSPA